MAGVLVTIGGTTVELQKALRDANGAIALTEEGLKELNKVAQQAGTQGGKGIDTLTKSFKDFKKEQVQQGRLTGFYVRELTDTLNLSRETSTALSGLSQVLLEGATQGLGFGLAFEAIKMSVAAVVAEFERHEKQLQTLKDLQQIVALAATAGLGRIIEANRNVTASQKAASDALKNYEDGIKKVQDEINNLQKQGPGFLDRLVRMLGAPPTEYIEQMRELVALQDKLIQKAKEEAVIQSALATEAQKRDAARRGDELIGADYIKSEELRRKYLREAASLEDKNRLTVSRQTLEGSQARGFTGLPEISIQDLETAHKILETEVAIAEIDRQITEERRLQRLEGDRTAATHQKKIDEMVSERNILETNINIQRDLDERAKARLQHSIDVGVAVGSGGYTDPKLKGTAPGAPGREASASDIQGYNDQKFGLKDQLDAQKKEIDAWLQSMEPLKGAAQTLAAGIVDGFANGFKNFRQVLNGIANALAKTLLNMGIQAGLNAIAAHLFQKPVKVAEATAQAGLVGSGTAAALASNPLTAAGAIPGGLAAMAEAMSVFVPVASAAGGYDIPGTINPLVQAHASEMVLPAEIADRVRNMTEGGHTFVFNAPVDRRWWEANQDHIIRVLSDASRDRRF